MAVTEWTNINGWALARGIRLLDLSTPDFLDVVTFWLFDGIAEDSARRLEDELLMPPTNATVDSDDPVWSADAEMAAFFGVKGK